MAASTSEPKLDQASAAASTPEQRAALTRTRWIDRLLSLWAPVTVFALIFGVYLVVVESVVCTYLWLQPVMQVLGALAFAWWVGLIISRFALRKFDGLRQARYEAEELIAEVERLANAHRAELKGKAWDELVAALGATTQAFEKGRAEVLEASKKLEALSEKTLARYRKGGLVDFGSGFVRALLIALAFRAVLIEPFKIPSGSMIPTLEIGDQIFVNKFIYGVRLPFTNYVPFVLIRAPKRGDVIVFNNPANLEVDYIKRIMGVPGDVLEFSEEGVSVNGQLVPKAVEVQDFGYWETPSAYTETVGQMLTRWRTNDWRLEPGETLYRETVDGQPHHILESQERAHTQVLPKMLERKFTVPEGAVFVMGDNRNNSLDSRFGLSDGTNRPRFVPYGNIKGKATVIWLSLAKGGFGASFFGGTGIRYDRFFKSVSMCGTEAPLQSPERDQF